MHSSRLIAGLLISSLASAVAIPEPAIEERQIINGLNCLVGGLVVLLHNLVGDSQATTFCQSVLGYTTSTAYITSTTTANTTATAFVPTGTATVHVATLTAGAVTAAPVATTVIASTVYTLVSRTCAQDALVKRQAVSLSVGAGDSASLAVSAVPTPSALEGATPSRVSVVCNCLGPPTPDPVTSTAIETATATFTQTVNVVTTQGDTVYVTPTITPTTTVTYTPTVTGTSCIVQPTAVDTSCGNQGMEWSIWADPNHEFLYEPAALQTSAPSLSGASTAPAVGSLSGSCDDASSPIQLYEARLSSCAWWTLVHRGYVYAGQTGVYTFAIPGTIDDEVYAWVGATAVAGYSSANPSLQLSYNLQQPSFQYSASAGDYIPLRVQFSQGPGLFTFALEVSQPDGSVLIASDGSSGLKNVVQFGCDGATTSWLPWGAEA